LPSLRGSAILPRSTRFAGRAVHGFTGFHRSVTTNHGFGSPWQYPPVTPIRRSPRSGRRR
jgi:hypothetical protein